MKKTGMMLLAFFSVLIISGCKEEDKSEAWYKQHPDETYKVYKKCLETGSNSDNCDAAHHAALGFANPLGNSKETSDKFTELLKKN